MVQQELTPTEHALLTLSPPSASTSKIVQDACAALAAPVLTSAFARSVFRATKGATGSISLGVVFPHPAQSSEEDLLALAVAALHTYAQINWTGPTLALSPLALFEGQVDGWTEQELNDAAIDSLAYCGEPVYHLASSTTFLALALQIFGLVPSPFSSQPSSSSSAPPSSPYGPAWTLASISIWRLRAGIVWLKVLDEPVPLPTFVTASAVQLRFALPADSLDRAHLTLSLSLLASLLSRSSPHSAAQREASTLAREAATEAGLEWTLTGRMGKRTKWQIDEKTQLVVLARDRDGANGKAAEEITVPEVFALNDDTLLERTAFTSQADAPPPLASQSTEADPDALSFPETAAAADPSLPPLSALDPSDQPMLSAFSQSVLLALSISTLPSPTSLLNLHADILSTAQVSAFVARVLSHPSSWSTTSMALLLRCRAEAGRSRTVERGVLQMQALVDQLRDGAPGQVSAISSAVKESDMAVARDRLAQFHALALPPAWELERELATRYLSLGISKSALEIFARLEMWEEVSRCWVSLERPEKGIEVIKDLLRGGRAESELVMEGRKGPFRGGEKREAKLWCILGELESNPEHYETAWTVSRHTSSRAQRSLGAVHWASGDWDKARTALALALAINPLFPRTWFVLGCCAMRAEDWKSAQEAFGRCVGLEDEDAESWSNLASCHLRLGENEGDDAGDETIDGFVDDENASGLDSTGVVGASALIHAGDAGARERLPFSRKRAAFHCLKQAIKHSYESWRMWYNYMIVSVDVGEMSEACRALGRVIEMRAGKDGEAAVDIEVLSRLVDAVTRDQSVVEDGEPVPYVDPNVGKGLAPRVEHLITDTILPRVTGSAAVFLQHARLKVWESDFAGALDAHLRAYRAGVATDPAVEHDAKAFRAAASQVEDVVGFLENFGPRKGPDGNLIEKEWKYQARSLVRTFLGRTKDAFEDEPESERLKELLKELK